MRGREGGLSWERVDVACLLSFRPELYLQLQTGSSAPERPDDPAWFRSQAEPINTHCWLQGADSTSTSTHTQHTRTRTHRHMRKHTSYTWGELSPQTHSLDQTNTKLKGVSHFYGSVYLMAIPFWIAFLYLLFFRVIKLTERKINEIKTKITPPSRIDFLLMIAKQLSWQRKSSSKYPR